jgi:putative ABC transport system ATP-binding protein
VSVSIDARRVHLDHGPSGSGKSTLFNMIGGSDKPSEGRSTSTRSTSRSSTATSWRGCAAEDRLHLSDVQLIPVMTALENVTLPMIFAGMTMRTRRTRRRNPQARRARAPLLNKPSELSGGQQQRVAIARAFANDPDHHPRRRADRKPRSGDGRSSSSCCAS